MREWIVDSFAGGGGASLGIEMALGVSPDVAINHDADALAMHEVNHPRTVHLNSNIWKIDPDLVEPGRPIGLMWASPDCFVPGTLVITRDGLRPIEDIVTGEEVLTHRARWRRVTSTLTQVAETVEVKGYGHYGLITTPGHLFYSKRITKRYPCGQKANGKREGMLRTLVENPYWPKAEAMVGKLWATPRNFPEATIPICSGVSFSEDFFYFLGRWIGDGSLNKGDVEICCGLKECDEFRAWIGAHPLRNADGEPVPYRTVDHGSTYLFVWGNAGLTRWLEREVRTGCERKRLPLWCLSMQRNWREALLRGYVDADGCTEPLHQTSSVSKELSLGIRLLANGLGEAVALYRSLGRDGSIEGRSFVGRDSYVVRWRPNCQYETTFTDSLHTFYPVSGMTPSGPREVVSLQVEEDESFVADGIVVHNCKHHSKAKGGKPLSRNIRDLAWVVALWAERRKPRVILLENVEEFRDWGPLGDDDRPIAARRGETFTRWRKRFVKLGYAVEHRELRACDYGAPTIRKRLFVIMRRDGEPIVWPAPTHGDPKSAEVKSGKLRPWRTAADIIDWTTPCPSIFLTREEGRAIGVNRPLAENTMARIAKGVFRYVLDCAEPFIAPVTHAGDSRVHGIGEPLRTVTAAHRGEHALVAPFLSAYYGKNRDGGERVADIDDPPRTVTVENRHAVVAASIVKHNFGDKPCSGAAEPLHTVTTQGNRFGLLAAHLMSLKGSDRRGRDIREPHPTVTAQGFHSAEVRAFLIKYYGEGGQGQTPADPLHTVSTRARFGIVAVHGELFEIADIGMRMLRPRELFRAQGFPDSYVIDRRPDGSAMTATAAVRMCGNSVCPNVAAALAAANYRVRDCEPAADLGAAGPLFARAAE